MTKVQLQSRIQHKRRWQKHLRRVRRVRRLVAWKAEYFR
jgi:hypothetical protein